MRSHAATGSTRPISCRYASRIPRSSRQPWRGFGRIRPGLLAGQPTSVLDLAYGSDELPPTDALLITGEMIKIVVRPSGTEPKLKCYLEAHLAAARSADLAATRAEARSLLATIRSEMSAALGL